MHKHIHFDLWLHDDDELYDILGDSILRRTTLHEWPLSCVQRLHCAGDKTYIYKVQLPPTVEPAFYRNARSPLLVSTRIIAQNTLLMQDIQAPHLDQVSLTEAAKLAVVDDILGYISQIEGDLPFMLDLRTIAAWSVYADTIVEYIVTLVETGRFQRVTWPMLATIKRHAYAADVLKVFEGEIGYVHADLSCENVLVAAEGYRVIDWQRPIWGPTALDRATLLSSMGLDPVPIVGLGVAQLGRLLLIAWLVEAALHWFPDGAAHYDTQIAHLIGELDAPLA